VFLHTRQSSLQNIIRRNSCVYVTLGTCYSVWMTVWYAGACVPAYETVIHTEYHQEEQLCLCDTWYLLFCVDDCLVCRSMWVSTQLQLTNISNHNNFFSAIFWNTPSLCTSLYAKEFRMKLHLLLKISFLLVYYKLKVRRSDQSHGRNSIQFQYKIRVILVGIWI